MFFFTNSAHRTNDQRTIYQFVRRGGVPPPATNDCTGGKEGRPQITKAPFPIWEGGSRYDVQTSSTIQAAADASFQAIFNQLHLSDAEVYKIAADQLQELRKVKGENEKLKEQLRRERYKVSQFELREEAREKGLEVYDD